MKDADNAILKPERLALMPRMTPDQEACWPTSTIDVSHIQILALGPNAAEQLFLQRYYELTRGHGAAVRENPLPPYTPVPDVMFV